MELLTLCRSCMVEVASWELQNFDNNNVEMFTFCTNIEVSEDDKLPKQFCCDCKIKVESCYMFIKKAQEVNEKFNNIVSWEDPSVIDKSDNLENPLKDNESNSLDDFDFNSNVQMDEIVESNFTSNSNKNLEIKVEIDNYSSKLSSPKNPEIEETSTNKDIDLPEMRLNSKIENFDTQLGRISKDNCTRNARHKKNKGKLTEVPESGRKIYNITTRSHKSHELNSSAKGKEQSNYEKIQFKCDYCNISYKFDKSLQNHLRSKHSEAMFKILKTSAKGKEQSNGDKTRYKCDYCKISYKFDKGLQKHLRRKHSEAKLLEAAVKSENLEDTLQDNNTSNLSFSSDVKMEENDENMCTSNANQSLDNKIEPGIDHSSPENSKNEIEESISNKESDLPDKKEVNPKAAWTCTICGQTYGYTFMISNHYKEHHLDVDNQYTCPHCPKSFSEDEWVCFHEHVQTHVESMHFACGECDARFRFGKQLAAHARAQGHSRPHVCSKCGMAFETKSAVMSHTQSHTENTASFLCDMCGTRCRNQTSFTNHIKAHLGELPYACNQCSFRTAYLRALGPHMMRHGERRYACEHCGKRFVEKWALTKHIRQVHTNERTIKCFYCPETFSVHWTRTMHIVRHHHVAVEDIPRRRYVRNSTGLLADKKPPKTRGKRGGRRQKKALLQTDDDKISAPAPQTSTSELNKVKEHQ